MMKKRTNTKSSSASYDDIKSRNTNSSSSTPLLETSILASLVQSRRHLGHTYPHSYHQDQDHHQVHHQDYDKSDLYVDARRALVELRICLSSLRSPQFHSPHSTLHDDDDDDDDDDHGCNDNDDTCLPIFPSPPSSQRPPPGLIPSHWKHWIYG